MKKFALILLSFLIALSFVSCSNINGTDNKVSESLSENKSQSKTQAALSDNGSKILIAYFSRAGENYGVGTVKKGNTRVLAEIIESELNNADMFEITTVTPYPKSYDEATAIAQQEQKQKARPKLSASVDNFDDYDTVFIGYPIWYSDMPMPIYTFLESYDFSGKTVIPFCTHAGSGLASTEQTIKDTLTDAKVLPGLAVKGVDAQNNESDTRQTVKKWLKELHLKQ